MRMSDRCGGWAAALSVCFLIAHAASADDDVAAGVVGAVIENPDCVGAAIANQAVEEGLRRGGRRLLSRLGINADRNAAPVPCEPGSSRSAGDGEPAPTAEAAPAPTPRGGVFSGLRQQRAQGRSSRDCGALGAGCADGMAPLVACMREVSFWGEMAAAVERKRDMNTWSPEQLAELNADIAAMHAAHAADANRVTPADASRPDRHLDWLTPEEYSAAATAASQKLNAHRDECNRKHARF